jgi:uncharacterized FlgJ-related protein
MKKLLTIILFFFSCLIIEGGYIQLSEEVMFNIKKTDFYYRAYSQDFNEELLKECIYYEKIQHPDIVLKQAKLETGNYTSELFWVANNLFGMRYPHYRETTAITEYKWHAKYLHWTDAVKDYRKWQDWYISQGYNIDNYFVFLQYIRYATDPKYILKIST